MSRLFTLISPQVFFLNFFFVLFFVCTIFVLSSFACVFCCYCCCCCLSIFAGFGCAGVGCFKLQLKPYNKMLFEFFCSCSIKIFVAYLATVDDDEQRRRCTATIVNPSKTISQKKQQQQQWADWVCVNVWTNVVKMENSYAF